MFACSRTNEHGRMLTANSLVTLLSTKSKDVQNFSEFPDEFRQIIVAWAVYQNTVVNL